MRVATWNLENFFPPTVDATTTTTQEAYDAKLATLTTTIAALAPDVLAVQEVGPPPAITDLATALATATGDTWHAETAAPDGRGIRTGLLARHPLRDVEQITAFPLGLGPVQVDDDGTTLPGIGRPALTATVHIDGRDVHVVSAHLKSKLLSFPGGRFSTSDEDERARYAVYALHRRAAEAAGIRAYVTRLLEQDNPGGEPDGIPSVVVAGDLNDDGQAATTQILYGPPGSEIGTAGFGRPDEGDGQRLWSLDVLISEASRYSRIYRGRRELIDHILVSAPLAHTVTVVGAGPGASPSITDDPRARRNEPGSDHRPVYADFNG